MKSLTQHIEEKLIVNSPSWVSEKLVINSPSWVSEKLVINSPSWVSEKLVINKNYKSTKQVKDRAALLNLISERDDDNPQVLDVSDIDISNLDDLHGIFKYVNSKVIDVSGWDTSHVKNMIDMFANCYNLEDIIGIENFKFDSCKNMGYMFGQSKKLDISDKIKDWKIDKKQTSISAMLWKCPTKPPKCLIE